MFFIQTSDICPEKTIIFLYKLNKWGTGRSLMNFLFGLAPVVLLEQRLS